MGGVLALVRRLNATHPGRAWAHYNAERGPILAGGMAYVALFSVFSILLVGFTVLSLVVGTHPDLQARVVAQVDANVPNLLKTSPTGSGILDPDDLLRNDLLSWAGIVAFVLALLSGLGWIDALREGVRAMFGVPKEQLSPVAQRLRDLVGLLTFGGAVLASALLSVVVSAMARTLLDAVGLQDGVLSAVVLRAASTAVVFVVDAAIFVVLLRVLAHLPIPWRDLREAALVGALAIGVLKYFAGTLLRSAGGSNPLFATAGVIVGVLVWMNLVSRVVLVTAAWAATDPTVVANLTATQGERIVGPQVGPAALGTASAVAAASRPYARPSFGVRAADRTTIAAGAVLGALAAAGVHAAGRGVRAARGLVPSRRDD